MANDYYEGVVDSLIADIRKYGKATLNEFLPIVRDCTDGSIESFEELLRKHKIAPVTSYDKIFFEYIRLFIESGAIKTRIQQKKKSDSGNSKNTESAIKAEKERYQRILEFMEKKKPELWQKGYRDLPLPRNICQPLKREFYNELVRKKILPKLNDSDSNAYKSAMDKITQDFVAIGFQVPRRSPK